MKSDSRPMVGINGVDAKVAKNSKKGREERQSSGKVLRLLQPLVLRQASLVSGHSLVTRHSSLFF